MTYTLTNDDFGLMKYVDLQDNKNKFAIEC